MDEFKLLGGLHNVVDSYIDNELEELFDKYNANYYLLYPLAAVELGARSEDPQSVNNLLKRCVVGFLYSKIRKLNKSIKLKRFDKTGLKKYLNLYDTTFEPLYQNYRFSREINDINPLTKARLMKKSDHCYQLTTSLVIDKYQEENFYFYGVDDIEKTEIAKKQIFELHLKFHQKIFFEQIGLSDLFKNVDKTLYRLCVETVKIDINKWNSNAKSKIFNHPIQLALVIGYFYYYAMLKSIELGISKHYTEDLLSLGKECIIKFKKDECINNIVLLSEISRNKVEQIIDYFINEGNLNILEFPLFSVEDNIITIPSLILVNDWQFSVIDGHYTKGIPITNRENTISTITEERIQSVLEGISNIAVAKRKKYSFVDENGAIQNSDIDYAIYDMTNNVILVIEAKWIDNHYVDEIDKRYGKILQTLNKIYSKQIEKHKVFLACDNNIDFIFNEDNRYVKNDHRPQIHYLAVDKRNQMHIGDKHMISEFMLIAFLKCCIKDNTLNLHKLWEEVGGLKTKVEYIITSDEFYEISIGQDTILVEKDDLNW